MFVAQPPPIDKKFVRVDASIAGGGYPLILCIQIAQLHSIQQMIASIDELRIL